MPILSYNIDNSGWFAIFLGTEMCVNLFLKKYMFLQGNHFVTSFCQYNKMSYYWNIICEQISYNIYFPNFYKVVCLVEGTSMISYISKTYYPEMKFNCN